MIHYHLRCSQSHGFEGWFTNSAGFEAQCAGGLVECPVCGDTEIQRALMTPALPRKGASRQPEILPPPPPAKTVAGKLPDQLRAALHRMRAEIERDCDYVGADFAAEARRIHDGEIEPRAIYGEASPEQAEALVDDGIDVMPIPWLPKPDA